MTSVSRTSVTSSLGSRHDFASSSRTWVPTRRSEIGWFEWASFQPFSHWSGSVTFTIPFAVANGTYRVTAVFDGEDNDSSNDRAVLGTIEVG